MPNPGTAARSYVAGAYCTPLVSQLKQVQTCLRVNTSVSPSGHSHPLLHPFDSILTDWSANNFPFLALASFSIFSEQVYQRLTSHNEENVEAWAHGHVNLILPVYHSYACRTGWTLKIYVNNMRGKVGLCWSFLSEYLIFFILPFFASLHAWVHHRVLH